ncbi:hypothetical protein PYW08_008629 [Mythimna loreyi]|uniref:Uncharacterized protein n=1 Tax=Mythimna loreyi TaxID=667449 RepID=A0ACC2QBP4_9NEOP|nr:hypothetical protein PYW08_008629 [Mythimna loreyi]
MCVKITKAFVFCVSILLINLLQVRCHIPSEITTPANKVEQHCILAETCVHDTIPVCGQMGDQTRTFLDLCDLLEFACDKNQIYVHIDDKEGCPEKKSEVINIQPAI